MSIETNKLMNLADAKVLYDDLRQRIEQSGGAVIDDTAGSGDTNKAWSADKLTTNFSSVNGAIDGVESDIESLDNGKAPVIYDTAEGAIATFADGADNLPMDVTVSIEPVQDLHGQDNPYPGGGGVNLLDASLLTVYGSTTYGMTATIVTDGFRVAGTTPTENFTPGRKQWRIVKINQTLDLANLDVVGFYSGSYGIHTLEVRFDVSTSTIVIDVSWMDAGETFDFTVKPVIYSGSTTPTAWSPYSNICPISGWTGCNVSRTNGNMFVNNTYTSPSNGISCEIIQDGFSVKMNGTAEAVIGFTVFKMDVIPGEKYTAKFEGLGGTISGNLRAYNGSTYKEMIRQSTADGSVTFTAGDWTHVDFRPTVANGTQITNQIVKAAITHGESEPDMVAHVQTVLPVSWQTEAGTVYGGKCTVNADGSVTVVADRVSIEYDGSSDEVWREYGAGSSHYCVVACPTGKQVGYQKSICNEFANVNSAFSSTEYGIYSDHPSLINTYFRMPNSSVTSLAEFKAWIAQNPIQLVYELAEPIVTVLPSVTALRSLLGINNVWADCGNVAVEYSADTKTYVDESIPSVPVQDVKVNGTSVLSQGVANLPIASNNDFGVVKTGSTVYLDGNNKLAVNNASDNGIKAGTSTTSYIVPSRQHIATFYGLAKLAGADMASSSNAVGTFTDAALKGIRKMLGIPNSTWELIADVTTTEDLERVNVTTDTNGLEFKLSEMYVRAELPQPTTGTNDYVSASNLLKTTSDTNAVSPCPTLRYSSGTSKLFPVYHSKIICGICESMGRQGTGFANTANDQGISSNSTVSASSIYGFRMSQYPGTQTLIPSGTNIKVYGIRIDE